MADYSLVEPTVGAPGRPLNSMSREEYEARARKQGLEPGTPEWDEEMAWYEENGYQAQFEQQLRDNGIREGSPEWEAALGQFSAADWREQQSRVEGAAATSSGRVGLIGGPVAAGKTSTQTPEEWFRAQYVTPDGKLNENIGGLAAGEQLTPEMITAMSTNQELMGALYERAGVSPNPDGSVTTLDTWNTSGGQLQANASYDRAARLAQDAPSFQGRQAVQLDTANADAARELSMQALQGMDADREAASRAFGQSNKEAALNREAALAGYAGANAQAGTDYSRAVGQYGQGVDQLAFLQALQRGEAGPSLAEQQSNRMLGEQVASQMAMAKSGSSFSPEAQRQAALSGEAMAANQRQQLAELRAAEQLSAIQQVNAGLVNQQAGAQSLAGLTAQQQQALLAQQSQLAGATSAQQQALLGQREYLGGITQQQQQYLLNQQGLDLNLANSQAGLSAQQRAQNDAMQQAQQQLALQYLQHGTGLEQQQALNDLSLYGIQVGQGQSAAALAQQQYQYQQNREDEQRNAAYQALGSFGEAAANFGMSYAQGQQQTPQPSSASTGVEYSYAPGVSPQGGYMQGGAQYSDARSKEIIAAQQSQIQSLLEQLSKSSPAARADGAGQPSEADRTLANLAGVTAPSWRYTEEARAAAPEATGPGTRIGYTTEQLKRAGPAGRSMVSTDPRTGLEQIDTGAASTFSLAALGQQQREIDRLRSELEAMQRSRGGVARG